MSELSNELSNAIDEFDREFMMTLVLDKNMLRISNATSIGFTIVNDPEEALSVLQRKNPKAHYVVYPANSLEEAKQSIIEQYEQRNADTMPDIDTRGVKKDKDIFVVMQATPTIN